MLLIQLLEIRFWLYFRVGIGRVKILFLCVKILFERILSDFLFEDLRDILKIEKSFGLIILLLKLLVMVVFELIICWRMGLILVKIVLEVSSKVKFFVCIWIRLLVLTLFVILVFEHVIRVRSFIVMMLWFKKRFRFSIVIIIGLISLTLLSIRVQRVTLRVTLNVTHLLLFILLIFCPSYQFLLISWFITQFIPILVNI